MIVQVRLVLIFSKKLLFTTWFETRQEIRSISSLSSIIALVVEVLEKTVV